jgi:hypothetical protein
VPPAPPLPDPNLTRINALRATATEQDDSGTATISTADYTVPASNKKRTTKPARFFDSQR